MPKAETYIPGVLEKIGYRPEMRRWARARDATVGRVARVDRGVLLVLSEHGPLRCTFGGRLLWRTAVDPAQAPCTGDWCVVRTWPDRRLTVEQVLPRSSAVPGGMSPGRVLCANADLVAVVLAMDAAPALPGFGPLLELARDSGARPLVVLTKADLRHDGRIAGQVADAAPGVDVLCTSSATGSGLTRLRELIDDRQTLALLGAPGSGKSSLVRALVGAQVLSGPARGRAGRELVALPGGGAVIDTAGRDGVGERDTLRPVSGGGR